MKYWGYFKSIDDVKRELTRDDGGWRRGLSEHSPDITDDEVLFAYYDYEDYDGRALVLFRRDGKLYEVNGGHCSCYGLEGQWAPEETTAEALKARDFEYDFHSESLEARAALRAVLEGL